MHFVAIFVATYLLMQLQTFEELVVQQYNKNLPVQVLTDNITMISNLWVAVNETWCAN